MVGQSVHGTYFGDDTVLYIEIGIPEGIELSHFGSGFFNDTLVVDASEDAYVGD